MNNDILVSILLPVLGNTNANTNANAMADVGHVASEAAALDRTVQAVLAQTERRWQLTLVVPAGSEGLAERWARRDPRIRVLTQAGDGRASALRCGLQAGLGASCTVFLDTEHAWTPDFLALATAFLEAHPLEDMVCLDAVLPGGRPAAVYRQSVYREQGRLREMLEVSVPEDARWFQGELARHLRWGEYTRLAVTLLRTECAERLLPALCRESAALEYRLQARLAARCAVNRIALPGAVRRQAAVSPERARQQACDVLAVFDEIHGRQWEIDPEVARLRRELLARTAQHTPLRARLAQALAFVGRPWSAASVRPLGGAMSLDLVEPHGGGSR